MERSTEPPGGGQRVDVRAHTPTGLNLRRREAEAPEQAERGTGPILPHRTLAKNPFGHLLG